MEPLFKELIYGNVPEGFSCILEAEEGYFYLYRTNPTKEQIMAFNLRDVIDEVKDARCESMFEYFRWRLNWRTKVWER